MKSYIKRFMSFSVLIFIVFIFQSTVLASQIGLLSPQDKRVEVIKEVEFEITSGLDTEKEKESTFDEQRTITGTAKEGTLVSIHVYISESSQEDSSETSQGNKYDILVGVSGIFSQPIKLEVGENIIDIVVSKEGCTEVKKSFTVNRKKREIMNELEKAIILPGEKSSSSNSKTSLEKSGLEKNTIDSFTYSEQIAKR